MLVLILVVEFIKYLQVFNSWRKWDLRVSPDIIIRELNILLPAGGWEGKWLGQTNCLINYGLSQISKWIPMNKR
jgi:hypothetical protein